jgi:hypothetical protein
VIGERHRWHAVRGYLYELGGDLPAAATAYAEAARRATNVAERDHLVRQAARTRADTPSTVDCRRRPHRETDNLASGRRRGLIPRQRGRNR